MIRLSFAEAGDTYYVVTHVLEGSTWHGAAGEAWAGRISELAETLRVEGHAVLGDPSREREVSEELGERLLADVEEELAAVPESKPLVVIRPSRTLADLPWGLLTLPSGGRMLQRARVRIGLPLGLQMQRSTQGTDAQGIAAVVDPHSSAPPILDRHGRRRWRGLLGEVSAKGEPGSVLKRTDFSQLLRAGARGLLFYGHCVDSHVGRLSQMGLLLSDTHELAGRQHPRILSARDLVVGTLSAGEPGLPDGVPGAELWPMPPRAAIIGCSSGLDARGVEPLGLAGVLHNNGADWILGTLWDVPSDAASNGAASQLAEAALRCLVADDPDDAFDEWQRSALQRWLDDPAGAPDPRTWASATVFTSADAVVESAV